MYAATSANYCNAMRKMYAEASANYCNSMDLGATHGRAPTCDVDQKTIASRQSDMPRFIFKGAHVSSQKKLTEKLSSLEPQRINVTFLSHSVVRGSVLWIFYFYNKH